MKHQEEVQPDVIPDPEDPPVAKRRGRPRQCPDTRTYNREYYHRKCKKELTCPFCQKKIWSASSLRKHIRTNLKCELVRARAWAELARPSDASSATEPPSEVTLPLFLHLECSTTASKRAAL